MIRCSAYSIRHRFTFYVAGILISGLIMSFCVSCNGTRKSTGYGASKTNKLKYASHLKMWDEPEGTFAEVYADKDTTKPMQLYIFPEEGATRDFKKEFPDAYVINKGTGNFLVYTSVFSSVLDELGAFDAIGSVVDASYFTDDKMRKAVKSGEIVDVGSSQQLSAEKLLAISPSLAMVSVYDGMDVSVLSRSNIPIVYMADNLEETPLGRAEWIKFISYLAGSPTKGDSIFNVVENEYNKLKSVASKSERQPKVLVETMYQGVWYVPGGQSYSAVMLADAGGDYPWKDTRENGSLALSFEEILAKASDSDVWIVKLFGEELTASTLKGRDDRNMLFAPVSKQNVWYSNTAVSKLYDEFPYHPDRLLKDYIYIFHPEILPGYSPRYFKKMTY